MTAIDQLQKNVDAAIATHPAAEPIAQPPAAPPDPAAEETPAPASSPVAPRMLRFHLTIEVGNLNANVSAGARVWASEINAPQYPVVHCNGDSPRDAAIEVLRQLDAAVAELRATVENDATWT